MITHATIERYKMNSMTNIKENQCKRSKIFLIQKLSFSRRAFVNSFGLLL